MRRLADPKYMPATNETPDQRWQRAVPLEHTPGQQYVEKRGISLAVATEAGVRYETDWNGRPAVVARMVNPAHELCSVHGRYITTIGKENKMFTIGQGGGMLRIGQGWESDPIIIVEGLFDALSLAMCGYSALATVGRLAPWLPDVCRNRSVILAFDANQPGEAETTFYRQFLSESHCGRLTPPGHSKDWNTALLKQGQHAIQHWLKKNNVLETMSHHG